MKKTKIRGGKDGQLSTGGRSKLKQKCTGIFIKIEKEGETFSGDKLWGDVFFCKFNNL